MVNLSKNNNAAATLAERYNVREDTVKELCSLFTDCARLAAAERGADGKSSEGEDFPAVLNTKQVAKLLDCSIPTARELYHTAGFPVVKVGKNYRVSKAALLEWCATRGAGLL